MKSDEISAERDEAAAEVLSIGYFTTLQVLFAIFLYSPGLVAFLGVFGFVEVGTFFTTASLWEFIIDGFFLYLLGLVVPFASLLWVMIDKVLHGWRHLQERCDAGCVPQVEQNASADLVHRTAGEHGAPPAAPMYRSAPLMAFALRQLGATVGRNLQCAHDAHLSGPWT